MKKTNQKSARYVVTSISLDPPLAKRLGRLAREKTTDPLSPVSISMLIRRAARFWLDAGAPMTAQAER